MDAEKKEKSLLTNIQEFERKLRLRGSLTPEREITNSLNVFEQVGITTSIQSEIKNIEQGGGIRILSPFSLPQKPQVSTQSNQFGLVSPHNLEQNNLNLPLKRFRFVNTLIMTLLLLAIIINFVIIFAF